MNPGLTRQELHRRLEELDGSLTLLERRVAKPEEAQEITAARRRYQEMRRRLDALPAEAGGLGTLEADYEALVDAVGHWMARQDTGRP
jgi:hypothetical protein